MGLFDRIARRMVGTTVVKKYVEAAWHAAGQGRRSTGWFAPDAHVNALLSGDVATLRRRSRAEARVNPWALNAIGVFTDSVVGEGIAPTPQTLSTAFREEIEEAWEDWVEEADADGILDFYGLQAMIVSAYREGGDVFVRLRTRRPEDGLSVPLQLQVLEAEFVDATFNGLTPGRSIRAGIEFNAIGKRTAYHMWQQHPGDQLFTTTGQQRVAVPAANVLHIYTPTRPGQLRGVPSLAAVLTLLHEIQETSDAHVMNQKLRNMMTGFETVPVEGNSVFGGGTTEADDDDQVEIARLEPASFYQLQPGHDVKFSEPPSGSQDHEAFQRGHLRGVSAGAGVTYEGMTGDLSQVNLSAIRSGMMEQFRRVRAHTRRVLLFQFCRPAYSRWLTTAIVSGRVTLPAEERGRMRQLLRPKWVAMTGQKYVNPFQELRATALALELGLTSRTREVPNYSGLSAVALDRERVADREREDALGLTSTDSSDPNELDSEDGMRDGGTTASVGGIDGNSEAENALEDEGEDAAAEAS